MGGRTYWLFKLEFDAMAYLEARAEGRQQWRPDPYLVEGMTFDEGIEEPWPGETTVPAVSVRPGDRGRSWIGYRSQGRQRELAATVGGG